MTGLSSSNLRLDLWPRRSFLTLFASALVALWAAILSPEVPGMAILRYLIVFGYLALIPGSFILRLLHLPLLRDGEAVLLSIGLSLVVVMLSGLAFNSLAPVIGVNRPISTGPLLGLVSAVSIGLAVPCVLGKHPVTRAQSRRNWSPDATLATLLLMLLPVLGIGGALTLNAFGTNAGQVVVLLFVCLTVLVVAMKRKLDPRVYPVSIFAIALALLYHASLVSKNLVEWGDISFEYQTSNAVVLAGSWNIYKFGDLNAMLSITIVPPVFSVLQGQSVVLFYKLTAPTLYALVPVGLYYAYSRLVSPRISFAACCFFVTIFPFYTTMLGAVRQETAELYLVLLMIIALAPGGRRVSIAVLSILFGLGMVVSHYALSYIYLLVLLAAVVLTRVPSFKAGIRANGILPPTSTESAESDSQNEAGARPAEYRGGTISELTLFAVMAVSWYTFMSGSSALQDVVLIGNQISSSIFSDFLNPNTTQGLELILSGPTLAFNLVYKGIQLLFQFFIVVGVALTLLRRPWAKMPDRYVSIALAFLSIAVAGILVPYFAQTLNTSRLYPITLLYLAPFAILGGSEVTGWLLVRTHAWPSSDRRVVGSKFVAILLAVFLLFNSGLLHEAAGQPVSLELNPVAVNRPHFDDVEVAGADWLASNILPNATAYADAFGAYLIEMKMGVFNPLTGNMSVATRFAPGTYLFLDRENTVAGIVRIGAPNLERLDVVAAPVEKSGLLVLTSTMDEIYDNGEVRVYWAP